MDSITRNFLNEFIDSKNYSHLKESKQFEYFVNFCVINKEYDSVSFDEKQISTGDSAQGVDGVGIIVNNKLCLSVGEVQQLIELNRVLTVTFVMIQAKTSSKFEGESMDSLFRWVKTFFSESADLFATEEMKSFLEIKDYIYANSKYMKERNPVCNVYYCTTGKWVNDANLINIIESNKKELDDLDLFDKINFIPCGSKTI